MPDPDLHVYLVYALPQQQHVIDLLLPNGSTVMDAVTRSGFLQRFPAIGEQPLQCAIFNRVVPLGEPLQAGDRIEVLRPLRVDPKEQRRKEAARTRAAAKRRQKG